MSAKISSAQSHIEGRLVARIIMDFHQEFRDTYGPDTLASSLCAVGPLQSMIGLAIANGQLALVDALAAKDAALSEMRAELDLARKALKPFAKAADQLDPECPDLKDTHGWTFQAGDFRAAARALASQDDGEER